MLLLRQVSGSRPKPHGSGTLLKIANSHLLLTAAHVADAHTVDQLALGLPPPNSVIASLEGSRVFCTPTKSGDHKDDPLDVAVIELRKEIAAEAEKSCSFVTCNDLDPGDSTHPNSLYLIVGFPIQGISLDDNGGGEVRHLDLCLYPKPRGSVCGENVDEAANFFIEYRSALFHRREGEVVEAPPPEGLSGSGIWRIARLEDQLREGTPPPPRLVGIETSAYGDAKSLKVTRIKFLTEQLRRWMPELRAPLDLLLPLP